MKVVMYIQSFINFNLFYHSAYEDSGSLDSIRAKG